MAFYTEQKNRRPLRNALSIAQQIVESLAQFVEEGWLKRQPQFTGDLRRLEEECQSIELIIECENETAFQFEAGVVPTPLQSLLELLWQRRFGTSHLVVGDSRSPIAFKTDNQIQYTYYTDSEGSR